MSPRTKYSVVGGSFALATLAITSDSLSTVVRLVAIVPAVAIVCFFGYTLAGKFRGPRQ